MVHLKGSRVSNLWGGADQSRSDLDEGSGLQPLEDFVSHWGQWLVESGDRFRLLC